MATEASSSSCSDMLGSLMLPSRAIGVKINNNNHNFVCMCPSVHGYVKEESSRSSRKRASMCVRLGCVRLCAQITAREY